MRKILSILFICVITLSIAAGCFESNPTNQDIINTFAVGDTLAQRQATPTDIPFSFDRYNNIRRAYWQAGMREKAINLPCPVTKPLGYAILFTNSGSVFGRFIVDGKVTYLNTWLTPNYYYRDIEGDGVSTVREVEMPDVDGTYGTKDDGIFFFTTDGKYIEWTGEYLYSDIPFIVEDPILKVEGN